MTVIDFVNEYPEDREKVFKTLRSCENITQFEIAKNLFITFKNKWSYARNKNRTIMLMVDTDEHKFNSEMQEILKKFC